MCTHTHWDGMDTHKCMGCWGMHTCRGGIDVHSLGYNGHVKSASRFLHANIIENRLVGSLWNLLHYGTTLGG